MELDAREKLLSPGMAVADLGAAPGGWTQVAVAKVKPVGFDGVSDGSPGVSDGPDGVSDGSGGRVVAADLLGMAPVGGAVFVRGDFAEVATRAKIAAALGGKADVVLSDMSPNLSGIASSDQAAALRLAELVAEFCGECLRPGGKLLMKSFAGEAEGDVRRVLAEGFADVRERRPEATRAGSRERFYVATRGGE